MTVKRPGRAPHTCPEFRWIVQEALEAGQETPALAVRHLELCPGCARFAAQLAGMGPLLRASMDRTLASIPEPDTAAVAAAAGQARRAPHLLRERIRGTRAVPVLALAAAAVLALGTAGGILGSRARSSRIALERGTREFVDSLFRGGLLEGAEFAAATAFALGEQVPLPLGQEPELFLRSQWRESAPLL